MACDDRSKPLDDSLVTLKIVLPGDTVQNIRPDGTRAGDNVSGSEAESRISALRFLVYDQKGTQMEIYKSVRINADWTSDDPMWDAASKSLRIPMTQGTKRIHCVANWADPSTPDMPSIDTSTAENETVLLATERKHDGVKLVNPPVMTASLISVKISADTQNVPIEFKRQVARVELCPNISEELDLLGARVRITGVKFRNLPSRAYLFPKSTLASPASITQWDQSDFTEFTSNVLLTQTAVDLETKCYIPEYKPSGQDVAAVMIVRADFNGQTLYYNIVVDPSTSATPKHKAFEIERNHTYRYCLTILGEGSATETTRSAGVPACTNLIYRLEIR
jgi:hypothetical protein